ncbi:MAG: hypothetical protein WAU42_02050, partial [Solirubrobacteraceae bacterium]
MADSPSETAPTQPGTLAERRAANPSAPLPDSPIERLPGARRAAVLMAALGPERAANVMQRMDEEAIESLSMEMARLSSVGAETTESVFGELAAETGEGQG